MTIKLLSYLRFLFVMQMNRRSQLRLLVGWSTHVSLDDVPSVGCSRRFWGESFGSQIVRRLGTERSELALLLGRGRHRHTFPRFCGPIKTEFVFLFGWDWRSFIRVRG
ncbi:hypothetical protein CDAR_206341 [Caerostris darwini]|uniref:Secreted protein n=1 Tax=Caerostris darwini TaxID=1538125 RepID=A0AAV4RKL6_9ARAC|nr:hypothetical protein CDAR_206341 [Caerostris darwini]